MFAGLQPEKETPCSCTTAGSTRNTTSSPWKSLMSRSSWPSLEVRPHHEYPCVSFVSPCTKFEFEHVCVCVCVCVVSPHVGEEWVCCFHRVWAVALIYGGQYTHSHSWKYIYKKVNIHTYIHDEHKHWPITISRCCFPVSFTLHKSKNKSVRTLTRTHY